MIETRLRFPVTLALVALACDQFTKWVMVAVAMQPPRVIPVFPGFDLTPGFNDGSSFGMLSGVMAGSHLLTAAATGALTMIFAVMAFRARHTCARGGFALVVGGALGSITGRLRQGAVTDFLDLYWRGRHRHTFNVADIAITPGAICILAASLASRRHKEPVLDQH